MWKKITFIVLSIVLISLITIKLKEIRNFNGSFEIFQRKLNKYENQLVQNDSLYILIDSKFRFIQESHQVRYHFIPHISLIKSNLMEIPIGKTFMCINRSSLIEESKVDRYLFIDSFEHNYIFYYIVKKN